MALDKLIKLLKATEGLYKKYPYLKEKSIRNFEKRIKEYQEEITKQIKKDEINKLIKLLKANDYVGYLKALSNAKVSIKDLNKLMEILEE